MATSQLDSATRRGQQLLLGGLVVSLLVAALLLLIALLLGQPGALVSIGLGLLIVVVFFSLGQLIEIRAVKLELVPGMTLALSAYLLRVAGIAAVLWFWLGSPATSALTDVNWLLATVIATVIGWLAGVVLVACRQRIPIYDVEYVPPMNTGSD